ncbi:hypothetical protein L6164_023941 [Bauhinia variegata]|uniref:Uncharacterized protein n=1 Tax=Bauhinia variegata TaxID=167791 RepID=A0ACB9LW11_BAUVA|nr:hypothetical protein L6164_023941 [Bauhinia variegata]
MDEYPPLPGSHLQKSEEHDPPLPGASSSLEMIRTTDLEKLKLGQPSRKRRRARTTVVKASIETFRQMVQELTGAIQIEDKYLRTGLLPFVTHCFLFPFNYEFTKEELVTLWIAEGLFQIMRVPISGQEFPEDVANEKFDLLVSMEIIVPSRTEQFVDFLNPKTRRSLYRVNKFGISSFERYESRCGYARISGSELNDVPETVLYLSVYGKSMDHMAFESMKRFKHLRTLFLIPAFGSSVKQVPRDLFLGLEHLRSMNLSKSLLCELPSSIGNLKSLRYIDLSYTPIKQLPETICNLHKLQTLKLRGCFDLVGLPIGMRKLTSLRHLDLDILRQLKSMPPGMGNLTNLQTLSAYLVGRDVCCGIGELKHISNLKGVFCISRIENVLNFKEAMEASLIKKEHLRKLELRWTDIRVSLKKRKFLNNFNLLLALKS